jgi:hypothetical protein
MEVQVCQPKYSWGDFYEAAKACDNYEEIKGKFAVFAALDKATTFEQITKIIEPLSRDQINWLNSPCLDGLIATNRYYQQPKYDNTELLPFPETCRYLLAKNMICIYMRDIINCCYYNNFETLKVFLECNQISHFFKENLYTACELGYTKIVNLILEFNVMYDNDISTEKFPIDSQPKILNRALCRASERGYVENIKLLLEKGADIHYDSDEPLFVAVRGKHINAVRFLIEKGADVNAYNGQALEAAVNRNLLEITKVLLDNGADIHIRDDITLRTAITNEKTEMIKLLLDRGANANGLVAVFKNKIDTVRLLLNI